MGFDRSAGGVVPVLDLYATLKSALAREALDRIDRLYQIEDRIRGLPPEERLEQRQTYATPVLNALTVWMIEKLSHVDRKSELAEAFNYSLNRLESLCLYTQDGLLIIDNNIAERSVRGAGVGRKNYLFF